mgnify:CR=1 FL=1
MTRVPPSTSISLGHPSTSSWAAAGTAALAATVVLASAWSMTQPKLYRATTKLIVEPSAKINNNQFDAFVNYWQLDRYIADQIQVLNTERLGQRVVDRLGLASLPEFGGRSPGPGIILGNLRISPVKESNVIEISLVGRDPQRVAEWLNVYVKEFIADNIEDGLERITPETYKKGAHHWLILHGRYVCKAREPLCSECPIVEWCEYTRKELP